MRNSAEQVPGAVPAAPSAARRGASSAGRAPGGR